MKKSLRILIISCIALLIGGTQTTMAQADDWQTPVMTLGASLTNSCLLYTSPSPRDS